MAMEPLQLASSAYSTGGAYAPTPANNFNIIPINPSYAYNTRYGNPYTMQPIGNQQDQGFGNSIVSNASSLKSAGEFVSNGFSFPQSNFVNNFGASMGFAPGTVTYGSTFGPSLPGAAEAFGPMAADAGTLVPGTSSALGGSTLSSTLGAAGIGALAGNFLGRIGGNSTGGSIGGALGAGIGNIIAPGIGGWIGGALGGIAGGFIGGGKPKTNADTFHATVNEDGSIGNYQENSINPQQTAGFAANQNKNLNTIFKDAAKDLGIKFSNKLVIGGGISTLHPQAGGDSHVWLDAERGGATLANPYYKGGDASGETKAYLEVLKAAANASGYTDMAKLEEWYAAKTNPQNQGNGNVTGYGPGMMPFVPVKDNQRFADYMSKYKQQGTP